MLTDYFLSENNNRMFWFTPSGPVKDSLPEYFLQMGYKCIDLVFLVSSGTVCQTNHIEKRLSGMNAHEF